MGSKHSKGTTSTSDPVPFESGRIPLAALQEATNNFDNKYLIGEGGFGNIYRGVLCDGTKVALKRRKLESRQSIEEFRTEIEMLSQLRHPHLVSWMGYCDENNEMILIYEYMENGTLRSHLYGSDLPTMRWEQRLEICIGVARGLHYLHTSGIIHCDVKSTNILLDENFVPKITDFGLSKKAPELEQTHACNRFISSEGAGLAQTPSQLKQSIDPKLQGKVRPDSLRKFGETAVKCLAYSGVDRPSMGPVLWNLEYALHLQEPVIQENSSIPIGELSLQINDFSHVDASSNAAQIGTLNSYISL
ncbi:hypothetical protein MTR67_022251 [Solanum verrucosum]|uniref:Protein kinase domain-containing protein n=1 Tax=Solanum verrucosum TaxID=315347 RepID=A0AAF0TQM0_SOLVR|nr:hypothetical protein MTR67_022251 [Solanum verrucosum]